MKRFLLAASALAALVALSACESEGGASAGGASGSANLEADAAYTQQQLTGARLSLADVPSGWRAVTVGPDGIAPGLGLEQTPGAQPSGCKELDALLARGGDVLELRPPTQAVAHFEGSTNGPWLAHQAGAWANGEAAKRTLDELDRALGSCETITQAVEGATITLKIARAKVAPRGDQTVAYTIQAEAGAVRATLGVLTERRGNLTSTLTWSAVGDPLSSEVLDGLSAKADAKLDALDG